ncbi:MAG: hypothetical protein JKY09_04840 [Crocinitomicaceae bacterium]|nr:hypothetical protein [Crocinitomicaceae bacterium]
MYWGALTSLFLLSIVKFMFAPFGGPSLELSFFETYFACVSGGIFGATVFYFSAGYFMQRAAEKRLRIARKRIAEGLPPIDRKIFTRMNKMVVKMKASIGIIGITFWAPFFLSVPIGSIITAKFYGDERRTFPLIILGMFFNGFVTTGLAYLF